jgi:membrane protein YqaA with SNARE-associated domain
VAGFFQSFFGFFLTWWGAFLMAALDSTVVFFLPFGIDTLVIYLSARRSELSWMYPLLATAGSVTGATVTYWIGKKAGEVGLERLISARRLRRIRAKVGERGAVAMAVPALLPPPFPMTPFILTCGALQVDWWRFFVTFSLVRLLRFGGEAVLARVYGRGILRVVQSEVFQTVVAGFIIVALIGTAASAVMVWRSTRDKRVQPA